MYRYYQYYATDPDLVLLQVQSLVELQPPHIAKPQYGQNTDDHNAAEHPQASADPTDVSLATDILDKISANVDGTTCTNVGVVDSITRDDAPELGSGDNVSSQFMDDSSKIINTDESIKK